MNFCPLGVPKGAAGSRLGGNLNEHDTSRNDPGLPAGNRRGAARAYPGPGGTGRPAETGPRDPAGDLERTLPAGYVASNNGVKEAEEDIATALCRYRGL